MGEHQIKHNFKTLLDKCEGNTAELKEAAAVATGLSIEQVWRLYSGRQKAMKVHHAMQFLEFVNKNLPSGATKMEMSDLIPSAKSETLLES